jgi:hypothetical protein
MRSPLDPPPEPSEPGEAAFLGDVGATIETVIPATVCLDDEGFRPIGDAVGSTEAMLVAGPTSGLLIAGDGVAVGSRDSSDVPLDRSVSDPELHIEALRQAPPPPEIFSSSGEIPTPAEPDPILSALQPAGAESPSADPFLARFAPAAPEPAEAHAAPVSLGAVAPVVPESRAPETGSDGADEADEEEYEEAGGRSLGQVLLMSYASALTLALLWLLWSGRVGQATGGPPSIPSDSLEAVKSGAFLRDLPKLAIDHRTTLGEPLRLGDLEITPVAVEARPETLVTLKGKKSPAEPGTLTLRLRLRNLSDDQVFEPIEPGFVRAPDRGLPETVLVSGDEPIFPYPLALQSERSIAGQDFNPLEPGAEREVKVVSAPGAVETLAPSMTWRLRVRTAPDQTDTIGIDFQKGDVHL